MNSSDIYILGAGGHAKVVASTLISSGFQPAGYFDDDSTKKGALILGIPVIGSIQALDDAFKGILFMGLGGNQLRQSLANRFPFATWPKLIHPSAMVHDSVQIGEGTVVFAGAIIQPGAKIGRHVIVNTGSTIDHDCVIEDFVHLAPGTHLAGNVAFGQGAFLGIGGSAIPGARVGAWTTVGAGSTIIQDLPPCVKAYGTPARVHP